MIDHFWLRFLPPLLCECLCLCGLPLFLASHYALFNLALHLEEIAFFARENIKSAKLNFRKKRESLKNSTDKTSEGRHPTRKSLLKGNFCSGPRHLLSPGATLSAANYYVWLLSGTAITIAATWHSSAMRSARMASLSASASASLCPLWVATLSALCAALGLVALSLGLG